jgi:hypothetical protein
MRHLIAPYKVEKGLLLFTVDLLVIGKGYQLSFGSLFMRNNANHVLNMYNAAGRILILIQTRSANFIYTLCILKNVCPAVAFSG